jgi:hypothetical protein
MGDGDVKNHVVPMFGKSLMMASGMYLAFAVGGKSCTENYKTKILGCG